jgi:hypothetical protein
MIKINSNIKDLLTKRKPDSQYDFGTHTVNTYGDEATIGIKTGIKPGPHYGGKGQRTA